MKDPIKLAVMVQIAFATDEETGEAPVSFPKDWEEDIKGLVLAGLIERVGDKVYRLLNKKVVDMTLKRKPKKQAIDEQLLSSDNLIIPSELKQYYELTEHFRGLFLSNLKSIGGRTINIEKARFGPWVGAIRLMFEADGVTLDELRAVYAFLKKDEFWRDKVQSTKKLREKFNTLYNQSKNEGAKSKGSGSANGGGLKVSTDYVESILNNLQS